MKIKNRIISILIVLLMLLNNGMVFAADEPAVGEEKIVTAAEAGKADGKTVGESVGPVDAREDFRDNKICDYTQSLPSDAELIYSYRLYNDSEEYRNAFLEGFKVGYQLSYDEAYRAFNMEIMLKPTVASEAGITDGRAIGEIFGAIYGREDYINGEYNNYRNYILDDFIITDPEQSAIIDSDLNILIDNLHLERDVQEYRESFIDGFKAAFKTSYEESYRVANLENPATASEAGYSDGSSIGESLGAIDGRKDYSKLFNADYKRNLPTDTEITDTYYLSKDNAEYRVAFINGFKDAYKLSYEEAYRAANLDTPTTSNEAGNRDGTEVGKSVGEISGKKDYLDGNDSDYLSQLPGDDAIIANYNLSKDNAEYREAFINGFKEAFKSGYEEAYRDANIEDTNSSSSAGSRDGASVGGSLGVVHGREAYESGAANNYSESLPDDDDIIETYNLDKDNVEYKDAFIKSFKETYKYSYEEAYRKANLEGSTSSPSEAGNKDGTEIGKSRGTILGREDYANEKLKNYASSLPSPEQITETYELDSKKTLYKTAFISAFNEAYESSYNEAFDTASKENTDTSKEAGYSDGSEVGAKLGPIYGRDDYLKGLDNNYMDNLPSDEEIIVDYNLGEGKVGAEYRAAFIEGFKDAFESSYEEAYRAANMENPQTIAYKNGFDKGKADGKNIANQNDADNILKPINLVELTDKQVEEKYKEFLSDKSSNYKIEFVRGYQDGFVEGYESVEDENAIYQDGKSKGYAYGKSLADKSNDEKTYIPFEDVKMDSGRVITINYAYLKDEDSDFISKFVEGYLGGFEQGYNDTILKDKEEEVKLPVTTADFGAALGALYGEMAGIQDYEDGKSSRWSMAIPKDSALIKMFDLDDLSSYDEDQFLEKFEESFKKAYEKAYYNAHFGSFRNSLEAGKNDGITFGTTLGKISGAYDYYQDKDLDYNRNIPSDRTITSDYSLRLDDDEYEKGFLENFKKAYKDSYIESYRQAKNNALLSDESGAYENGSAVGAEAGKMQANIDQLSNDDNDWKNNMPSASKIIANYDLTLQTEKYRESFISGFWDGYVNGYTDTYKEISQEIAMNRNTFQNVPISGADLNSLDNGFVLSINKGTYFRPIVVTIEAIDSLVINTDNNFMPASNIYRVDIVNPSSNYDDNKYLELSFEYYGNPNNGGIYKRTNNKWEYIPSTVDRGKGIISASVKPSSLINEMTYGVFIDNNTTIFRDARVHWASNEIDAYVRRDVISGYSDNTFQPDNSISRAEFLTLLSRVYNWNTNWYASNTAAFKDSNTFGYFNNIINYATNHNYIYGYGDGTFKPGNPISYAEVEIIMNRVIPYSNFRWIDIANNMLYEKKVRSNSFNNMKNNITRAEVVYMLFNITE